MTIYNEKIETKDKQQDSSALIKFVARGSGLALMGGIAVRLLNLLIDVLLSRSLGANGFGALSVTLSGVELVSNVSNLGVSNAVVRYASVAEAKKNDTEVTSIVFSSLLIVIATNLVAFITLFVLAPSVASSFLGSTENTWLIRILALLIPVLGFSSIFVATLRAYKRIGTQQLLLIGERCVSLVILACLLYFNWGIKGAALGSVIAAGLGATAGIFYINRLLPNLRSSWKTLFPVQKILRFSFPIMLSGLAGMAIYNLDKLMIGYYSTTQDIGIYTAASRISTLPVFVLSALLSISSPILAQLYATQEHKLLGDLYRQITQWVLILCLPQFIIILLLPEELLYIFGNGFDIGWSVLLILVIGQLINCATGPIGNLFVMIGKQDVALLSLILILVLNFFLNMWFIPLRGAVGAAIATSISLSLIYTIWALLANRLTGIKLYDWNVFRPIGAAALALALGYIIKFNLTSLPFLERYITTALVLVLYLIFVYAVGITAFDKQILLAGIRRLRVG